MARRPRVKVRLFRHRPADQAFEERHDLRPVGAAFDDFKLRLDVDHLLMTGFPRNSQPANLPRLPVRFIDIDNDALKHDVVLLGYLASGIIISMVVLLTALLIGSLVSQRLHRIFSSPILDLAEIVQTVIAKEDYSLRAPKQKDGDIGALTDGLNQMLTQIQRRNEEVRASEQRFRQLAESIGAVFWMTDANKGQMIYISPGYEEIWGQSCASLYASARGWYDSIHPEDRERMLEVALSRQKSGDYDEEYRIVRPDGTLRWIRDRAFPVRNEAGEVYRIAGIAEDITDRKRLEREVLEISDREQCRLGHRGEGRAVVRTVDQRPDIPADALGSQERAVREDDQSGDRKGQFANLGPRTTAVGGLVEVLRQRGPVRQIVVVRRYQETELAVVRVDLQGRLRRAFRRALPPRRR